METSKKQRAKKLVSPFNWRLFTAGKAEDKPAKAARRPVSALERAERILAHRWGNPYCKPGMP